jgi:carbamoyltransferase
MWILGISAYYHDSAAALLRDGHIVAAVQEERLSRRKHDEDFPHRSIAFCANRAGIEVGDIDYVVFYEKPFLKFERLLETYLATAPRGFRSFAAALPVWLRQKLFLRQLLADELRRHAPGIDWARRLLFTEHHLSHAASAFFPSPFAEAAVLTVDAAGEWATTSFAIGRGRNLEIVREIHFPDSLGLLYSAFTHHCGFKVNSGEYKLMGLAPYGRPVYADRIRQHLVTVCPDGSFRLNQQYFAYCTDLAMTSPAFDRLFGGKARLPAEPLEQRHMDLAASVQRVVEDILLRLCRALAAESRLDRLCLAGGVALNCVANGKILRDGAFKELWIQPAAGDAGGALGAALHIHHAFLGGARDAARGDTMQGSFLGPEYTDEEIVRDLHAADARYERMPDERLFPECARLLAEGAALAWVQGRMEFGPRALGGRSILADARNPAMQRDLNLKVKFRESFRPFAPAVLAEDAAAWFDLSVDSPYMLLVAEVAASRRLPEPAGDRPEGLQLLQRLRSTIPAVTHVDGSARVQTVRADTNPRFHRLLTEFKRQTGCPVLVNTSFNVRGEPIVCSPADAYRCFMGCGLDYLVIGNYVIDRRRQSSQTTDHAQRFLPD